MSYDRRERIRQLLQKNEVVKIKDLMVEFPNVTSMTIRRDLAYLESMGEIILVRGGARAYKKNAADEAGYFQRAGENIEAKRHLAELAVKFIEPGRSVFLDSGSTIMEIAKIMPDLNLSLLTTDPLIALEIVKRYNPTVNLMGGVLSYGNHSVSGLQAINYIKNFNIDIAFIVPSAFSLESGFSCGNNSECDIKHSIVKKSRETYLILDSSKFEKNLPFTFAQLEDIDVFITDKKPDDKICKILKKHQIKLIY